MTLLEGLLLFMFLAMTNFWWSEKERRQRIEADRDQWYAKWKKADQQISTYIMDEIVGNNEV